MKRILVLGYTLVEVVIVLAIIAILAAIAVPSYQDYVLETRRSDAYIALTVAAAEQERYYALNNTYISDIQLLGGESSPEGFYTLSVEVENGGYLLMAEPITGGVQTEDSDCLVITLNHLGVKSPVECW